MIDISKLSRQYSVRTLDEDDIDIILDIYNGNKLFYKYSEAKPTKEQVLEDMHVAPPQAEQSSKYFFGFFEGTELIAVMDLIDGYPNPEIAYLGLFMMNIQFQGKQVGSSIIHETEDYLKTIGIKKIRLAINKGNPQSTHFWGKNGYIIIREVDKDKWGTLLEAEKTL